jgi:methionyl-tRNA formyltransferase
MHIVFLGTGEFAVPALRALVAAGHVCESVISQPDRPAGRGRAVRPTPVHAAARELGLRHVQAEDVDALDRAEVLGDAELGVVAAFGQKIGGAILAHLPRGCVNIHGSLLPKYRGAAPFQWAIINGETETGVTVFQLNERWDAGAIWGQARLRIGETETAAELHDRLAALGADLIVEMLAVMERGEREPTAQDASQASRAPKLSKADGQVDWHAPAVLIVRRIHGLWSWPAASGTFHSRFGRQESVQFARARVADRLAVPSAAVPVGAVAADLTIQAGSGRVRLLEVRPAGGKLMSFEAFARGRDVGPGDRFSVTAP